MKLKMSVNPNSRTPPSTLMSLKQSWQMLRENYKAFLFTEFFAIAAFLILFFGSLTLLFSIISIIPNYTFINFFYDLRDKFAISLLFRLGISLIFGIILMGFMNCQFGLANDIINSGDMFAQFKGSFHYFRSHWAKFYFLTILQSAISMIFSGPFFAFKNSEPAIGEFTFGHWFVLGLRIIFQFFWFLLWIHSFPSVVYQNNLWRALKESYLIFKTEFRRIVKAWGIFFTIFFLPNLLLNLFIIIFPSAHQENIFVLILALGFMLLLLLIGFPLLTLLATGIYNNSYIRINSKNSEIFQNNYDSHDSLK